MHSWSRLELNLSAGTHLQSACRMNNMEGEGGTSAESSSAASWLTAALPFACFSASATRLAAFAVVRASLPAWSKAHIHGSVSDH
jgi:hypothetical protein